MHDGVNADYPDVFKQHIEIFNLLARIVDFIPLDLCAFQRLAGGYRFVEIWAGAIKLFFNYERRM